MTASPLVATKLFVPKLREGIVERLRLSERLQRGAVSRLTVISAPAGFGKTTLLTQWLAAGSGDRGVAWLSLDKTDNDPVSFWSHLIAALETAAPGIGDAVLPILQSGQQPVEVVLSALVNALTSVSEAVDLILDDYHVIDHPDVQTGMTFLLEHLPPQIRMVISTRADPALPLARLRARGELIEVRSADLRFTSEEAAAYLTGAMGLSLTAKDISILGERTEGWIAALQLAVLSLEGRDDAPAFIAGFAGSDRYVVDYLVEEVLQRQPDDVRGFLLHTCFLDRLSGPLCDAVTSSHGGKAMLEGLDRENLFVVPLDDRRQWYRYHHLFADVLLTHFADELRQELPILHRRASDWYAQQGERLEAIRHALAGKDLERAADLIEVALPEMQRNRGEAILRRWAHVLPQKLVRTRPVLGIGLIGGLVSYGEFEGIEDRLRDVERCLAAIAQAGTLSSDSSAPWVVVVDETQLPRVPGAVELYRAALAQVRGDVPGLIKHAQRVLELAPADDHLSRAAGSSMLGIAYWSQGNLAAAHHSWSEGKNGLQRAGHIADTLGVSIALADILLAQGHLRKATQTYEQALQVVTAQQGPVLRGAADMHAGLSELYRERNDLQAAHQQLLQSEELGEEAGLPQHPYRWRVASAHLKQDEGDLDGADKLLEEADRLYVSDFFPYVRPVAAMRARVWIAQGRLDEALRWQRDSGLGIGDELTYLREFEHITLARLLAASSKSQSSKRSPTVTTTSRWRSLISSALSRMPRPRVTPGSSSIRASRWRHSSKWRSSAA
jgi:LuxR family maltose regulon positive regulatory protein